MIITTGKVLFFSGLFGIVAVLIVSAITINLLSKRRKELESTMNMEYGSRKK